MMKRGVTKPTPRETRLRAQLVRARRAYRRDVGELDARNEELRHAMANRAMPIVIGEPGDPERIIQIATQRIGAASVLLGLTARGTVLRFQHQANTWAPMPMERGEVVPYVKLERNGGE